MILLAAVTLAQEVKPGEVLQVEGPAVVLSTHTFDRLDLESRHLAACHIREDQAGAVVEDLRERLHVCRTSGLEVADEADTQAAEQLELVGELGERLERAQRRVQVAGAVGLVAGVGLTLGAAWAVGQVAR